PSYFDVAVILVWPWGSMLKAIIAGLSTVILFAVPSLLAISRVKPGMILRRDVSGEVLRRRDLGPAISFAATLVGLWGIAVWVGSSIKYATVFAGILIGSLLVLAGIGRVLLRGLRALSAFRVVRNSAALRHGGANLYRPGAHSTAILASLGIGV